MFNRLLRMVGILAIVPILHIIVLVLIGIANHHTELGIFLHWLWTLGELTFLPYAIRHGYYPSQYEIIHMPLLEYVIAIGFLMLCWITSALITAWILRRLRPYLGRVLIGSIAVIVVCFAVALTQRTTSLPLPIPETAIISIDTTHAIRSFPLHHRGFSQGGEGQMMQAGYFEQAMEIIAEIRPRYIRIDHLYDYYNVLSFDADGEAVYDFSELDRIVDAIFEAGAEPLMSLSYAPPATNPDNVYTRPNDLAVWGDLVYETVYYYNVERDLNIQYWEVWNEPNLSGFWQASIRDYLDMYHVTAEAVKRADNSALVGGPATSSGAIDLPILYRFTEESWVTGLINYSQRHNLPLDFVSWHRYDRSPHIFREDIAIHERWLDGLNPKPLMLLTEWNYTGGDASAMDTGQTTAYLAQTLATLAETNLDQAYYFEPIDGGEDWIGRWGLIRADGTRKPSFYAFTLFDRLDGMQIASESNHPNIGAIATQSDDVLTVLIWNNTNSDEDVELDITGMGSDVFTADMYGVDRFYGNSYYTDATTDTFIETFAIEPTDNQAIELSLDVPTNGIRLLEISADT